jgi:hypothetical protein
MKEKRTPPTARKTHSMKRILVAGLGDPLIGLAITVVILRVTGIRWR